MFEYVQHVFAHINASRIKAHWLDDLSPYINTTGVFLHFVYVHIYLGDLLVKGIVSHD